MATIRAYVRDHTRECTRPFARMVAVNKPKTFVRIMRKTKATKKSGCPPLWKSQEVPHNTTDTPPTRGVGGYPI